MNMTCVPQSFIIISKNFKQYFVNKCIFISFNNYIVRKLKNRFFLMISNLDINNRNVNRFVFSKRYTSKIYHNIVKKKTNRYYQ